jgi:hypothetical protein
MLLDYGAGEKFWRSISEDGGDWLYGGHNVLSKKVFRNGPALFRRQNYQ